MKGLESFFKGVNSATLQVLRPRSSLLGEGDSNMQSRLTTDFVRELAPACSGSLGGELFVWRWHLLAGRLALRTLPRSWTLKVETMVAWVPVCLASSECRFCQ